MTMITLRENDGPNGDDFTNKGAPLTNEEFDANMIALYERANAVPPGGIQMYGGTSAPAGWLLCHGTAYQAADYPALYAVIGTTFGASGAGTFKVPDFRGRSPLGVGQGSGLTLRALGQMGGAETHVLVEAELASHSHGTQIEAVNDATSGGDVKLVPLATGTEIESADTGGNQPHNNMHPFLGVNFIIKT